MLVHQAQWPVLDPEGLVCFSDLMPGCQMASNVQHWDWTYLSED